MPIKEENMSKAELRKYFFEMRNGLSREYRQKMNFEISSRLLCSDEYSKADLILTYVSVGSEVDTIGIIHSAFANRKKVAVPLCVEGNNMEFYLISSMDDLKVGKYGLKEPDTAKCKKAEMTSDTLCIVPALSFDAKGYRLGRGGGYYDRFLKDYEGVSVGLCYHSFLRLSLPVDEHDRAVDAIVTENFLRELNSDK